MAETNPHRILKILDRNLARAAIEATNGQLASSGLYVAHIFDEEQLIIRPDWYVQKQRIHLSDLGKITLYRPATLDLILTKMVRAGDPEDRRDILTMIALDRLSPHAVRQAIAAARVPDLPEVIEQFRRSKAFIEEQLANQPDPPRTNMSCARSGPQPGPGCSIDR